MAATGPGAAQALVCEAAISPATMLLTSLLPTRVAFEVPEIVAVALVLGQLVTFAANQMRVLLPFTIFSLAAPPPDAKAGGAAAAGDVGAPGAA